METDRVIEETGVGDPLADTEPKEPAKQPEDTGPEDATPDPDHGSAGPRRGAQEKPQDTRT
jgi:hypothetical protein